MTQVQEINKYLHTDMTAAGVKSITPQIEKVVEKEPDLMEKIDSVIKQIDAMRGGK